MEPIQNTPATQEVPSITEQELAHAVTNDPILSPDEFMLGDRKFKICHLTYKENVKFLALVMPLFEGVVNKFTKRTFLSVPDIAMEAASIGSLGILKFAEADLPELARIVCSKTDPNITVEEVMELGQDPITLGEVVMKQLVRQGTIKKFSQVFQQLLARIPKKSQK
jgi:hypothetical protein